MRWTVRPGLQLRQPAPLCSSGRPQARPLLRPPVLDAARRDPQEGRSRFRRPAVLLGPSTRAETLRLGLGQVPPALGPAGDGRGRAVREVEVRVGLTAEVGGPPVLPRPQTLVRLAGPARSGVWAVAGLPGEAAEELSPERQAVACSGVGGPGDAGRARPLRSSGRRGLGEQGPKPSESRKQSMVPAGGVSRRPL